MVLRLYLLFLLGFARSWAITVTHSANVDSITLSWSNGAAYLYKPVLKLGDEVISNPVLPASSSGYTFINLKPNSEYVVGLTTVDLFGKVESPLQDKKVGLLLSAPEAPKNLACTKVTDSSISLSWTQESSGNGDASFDVVYGTKGGSTTTKTTQSTKIDLAALKAKEYYYISVYTKVGNLQSPPSKIGPIFTQNIPKVDLLIEHIGGSTYRLAWDFTTAQSQPICPIYSNSINIFKQNEGLVYRHSIPPATQTFTHEFDSGSQYDVTVTGDCISRVGIYAVKPTFKPEDQPPGPPTGLKVSDVTETSITISWEPPVKTNGQITGYSVKLVDGGQPTETADLSHTFINLQSGHKYTMEVMAKNTLLGQAASVTGTTKLSADQKLTPPEMSPDVVQSVEGVRVSWSEVSKAIGYGVSYWPEGNVDAGQSVDAGLKTTALLTGLTHGKKYLANVVAFGEFMNSDPSKPISFIYDNGMPNLPSNLMAKVVGIGRIHVTWDKPKTRAVTTIFTEVYKGPDVVKSGESPESSGLLEVSELPASSVLTVKVWAARGEHKSNEKIFEGLETPPPAPKPPSSVKAEVLSPFSIQVTWELPTDNSNIEKSEVSLLDMGTGKANVRDYQKPMTSADIGNLQPYTLYNVLVKTKSHKQEGLSVTPESYPVTASAHTWPTGPAEVGVPNQAVQLTADGDVKATWSHPAELRGVVDKYNVRAVNNANSASLAEESVPGDLESVIFRNLPGKTPVAVYVKTAVKPTIDGAGGFESTDVLLGLVETPDNGNSDGYGGGLSGGAIAGIVIAIILVLLILAFVVYKMTKGSQVEEVEFEWSEDGEGDGEGVQGAPGEAIELQEKVKAPKAEAPKAKAPKVKLDPDEVAF